MVVTSVRTDIMFLLIQSVFLRSQGVCIKVGNVYSVIILLKCTNNHKSVELMDVSRLNIQDAINANILMI